MSKKDFTGKAKSILGNRGDKPASMEEFLADDLEVVGKAVKMESQETGKLENRNSDKTEKTTTALEENNRSERYEWRHTPEMSTRIQRLLIEMNQGRKPKEHKIKIVDVIEEAVDAFLKQKGF